MAKNEWYDIWTLPDLSRHWTTSRNVWLNNSRLLWPKDVEIGGRMRLCLWNLRFNFCPNQSVTEFMFFIIYCLWPQLVVVLKGLRKLLFVDSSVHLDKINLYYINRIERILVYWKYHVHLSFKKWWGPQAQNFFLC